MPFLLEKRTILYWKWIFDLYCLLKLLEILENKVKKRLGKAKRIVPFVQLISIELGMSGESSLVQSAVNRNIIPWQVRDSLCEQLLNIILYKRICLWHYF
jgi:hypothetical protein